MWTVKLLTCPVCHINKPRRTPRGQLVPCVVCQKAIDGASGKPWINIGGFSIHPDSVKKAGLLEKEK